MDLLTVDKDVTTASTLPAYFYNSTEFFEASKEKIFTKTWQFCPIGDIPESNNFVLPFELLPGMLDEPLMFSRNELGQLNCLSNVCTHRGSILVEAPCSKTKQIRCPYHGRRFDLSGNFVHMPGFNQNKNFPSESDTLPNVPFGQFGPFLFASLFPAHSFEHTMGAILNRLSWMPMETMKFEPARAKEYTVNAHWALYCENYLEGLHIPFVHPELTKTLDFQNYSYEIGDQFNLQLAIAAEGEVHFDIPIWAQDYGKKIAAYYYWIFPNTMLNFYPWGCSVNIVQPLAPDRTKISFLPFIMDKSKLDQGAGGNLDKVEMEDEHVVELMQRGLRSRLFKKGRFSATQEQGAHHFHQLICNYIND